MARHFRRTAVNTGLWAGQVVLVLSSLLGCDGITEPSRRSPLARRLEISGPGNLAPTETAGFVVRELLADGSSKIVSNQVNWSSSAPSVLSVSGGGLATAHQSGEAVLSATYESLRAAKEVTVVPAGTFRLSGKVVDADSSTYPVHDAHVVVMWDGGGSLSTVTGIQGEFRLYGVPGNAQLQVTKPGYDTSIEQLSISNHQAAKVIALKSQRADIAGTYWLTISAAAQCRADLPEDLRDRSYQAVVSQRGPWLDVKLQGATFFKGRYREHGGFVGSIQTDGARFYLEEQTDTEFFYPAVLEVLAPPPFFYVPAGIVTATVSAERVSGSFDGVIGVRELVGSELQTIASCSSTEHQFVLAR